MGKKSKKGAAGGDIWDDEELAQDMPQAEEFGTTNEDTATPEPAEDLNDFLSSIRSSKKKKEEKEDEKAKAKDGPRVLTKNEERAGSQEEGPAG